MQTAIASSSISPYMWIVTGPISKKPLEGDGIDAITRGILPIPFDARRGCPALGQR